MQQLSSPPLSPTMDALPKLPGADAKATSKQLADTSARTPPVDQSHESASVSQINALYAALQDSASANMAIHDAMREANRKFQMRADSTHAMNMAVHETIQEANQRHQMRAETLETKIGAFMTSVSERLGAIEKAIAERPG